MSSIIQGGGGSPITGGIKAAEEAGSKDGTKANELLARNTDFTGQVQDQTQKMTEEQLNNMITDKKKEQQNKRAQKAIESVVT